MSELDEKKKRKKAGTESSKESSLRDWFKRKGAKGKKGGWVDCNAPDGKGGYKSCGRSSGEKRKKYPACRPTPGACKERGRGKSWGKKGSKKKRNENMQLTTEQIKKIIQEELANVLGESSSDIASLENLWNAKEYNQVEQLVRSLAEPEIRKWYMGKKYKELDDRFRALAEDPYYNQGTEIYEQYDMEMEDLQALEQELKALEDNNLTEKKGSKRQRKKKAKKDACYRKVKSRYKKWPSAYASGALVQCRKVGAKNWGNKSKKNEELELQEEFKQHDMFDPKTGKKKVANVEKDHHDLAKKGYTHIDPQDIIDLIDEEGGALGLKNLIDKFGKEQEEEILKTLKAMDDVGQHEEGDYIRADDKEIDVVKEAEMEEAKKKKPCKPAKGKRFAKRVNGKCRSFGQAGKAKGGGDRIRPGTKKGDAYCARSAKIKKCKNPPCANDLSRKKWKCRGSKSMREEKGE
jgi:hypothetical protein